MHSLSTARITGTVAVLAVPKPKCPKCGTITGVANKIGMRSCCAPGGAWFGECGKDGEAKYTWTDGLKTCECETSFFLKSFTIIPLSGLICY